MELGNENVIMGREKLNWNFVMTFGSWSHHWPLSNLSSHIVQFVESLLEIGRWIYKYLAENRYLILHLYIWGTLWVLFLYYEALQIFQILPSPTHYRITTIEAIGRIVNTLEIHLDCTFYTTFVVHGQAQGVYELFSGEVKAQNFS